MLKRVTVIVLASCIATHAQGDCDDTVRSASMLTFAEIECRDDFGAGRRAEAIQSCASLLSEPEFDRITREADGAFRSRILKEGLASVCAQMRQSAGR